jgi:hypothetical protein
LNKEKNVKQKTISSEEKAGCWWETVLYVAEGKQPASEEVYRKPAHTQSSANQAGKTQNLFEEKNMILY